MVNYIEFGIDFGIEFGIERCQSRQCSAVHTYAQEIRSLADRDLG